MPVMFQYGVVSSEWILAMYGAKSVNAQAGSKPHIFDKWAHLWTFCQQRIIQIFFIGVLIKIASILTTNVVFQYCMNDE